LQFERMGLNMEFLRKKIDDGVYLNTVKTDKFKTGYFSVNFLTALNEKTASSAALLPFLLKRGCAKYGTITEVNRTLEEMYGACLNVSVRKKGEMQIFGLSIRFIDGRYALNGENMLALAVDFMCEILFAPKIISDKNNIFSFDPEYIESEKSNLIDIIEGQINEKRTYSIMRLHAEMCKNELYGTGEYGSVEAVKNITPASLYSDYTNFLSAADIEMYYIGSENAYSVETHMTSALQRAVKRAYIRSAAVANVVRSAVDKHEEVESLDVLQGKLCLGFRTSTVLGDDAFNALTVMNSVYGAGVTSKLFVNVREKLHICYYCSSSLEKLKGLMTVSSGVEFAKKQEAEDEILFQLNEVRLGHFDEYELDSAKKAIINALKSYSDSPSLMEDWYLTEAMAGTLRSFDTAVSGIESVTHDEVQACAAALTLDTVYFLKGIADIDISEVDSENSDDNTDE